MKKIVSIIVFSICISLFTSCSWWQDDKTENIIKEPTKQSIVKTEVSTETTNITETESTAEGKIIAATQMQTYKNAVIKQDITLCKNLSHESMQNECLDAIILEKAQLQQTPSICKQITNKVQKRNCKLGAIVSYLKKYEKTLSNNDLCNKFENDSEALDICINLIKQQVAYINENKKDCFSLQSEFQTNCLNSFIFQEIIETANSIEVCESMPIPQKFTCKIDIISRQAIEKNDISHCSTLDSEQDTNNCQRSFIFQKLLDKRSITICDNISDKKTQNYCKKEGETILQQIIKKEAYYKEQGI